MTQPIDPHDAKLAELFDLDYGEFDEDLPFYESLAQHTGGPVLELGVGTGRVALPLARGGQAVWGIDNNEAMLASARCKAGDAPNVQIVSGDMRDFDLGRSFALIYAGYGAFHHLLTPDDQLACFRSVERHLAPDGLFVFDLRAIFATDWEDGDSVPLLHDWTRELPDGETVTKLRSVRVDRASQVQHETYYFDRVAADGSLRRLTTNVDLRFSTRYEIEGLLREAGLEIDQLYGGFDLSPYDGDSELMITIARKRART
jgi:SAM-dependent methyltransferase